MFPIMNVGDACSILNYSLVRLIPIQVSVLTSLRNTWEVIFKYLIPPDLSYIIHLSSVRPSTQPSLTTMISMVHTHTWRAYLWESINEGTTHIYESLWMKKLPIYMRVCKWRNYPYLWESVYEGTTHIYESLYMKELPISMRVYEWRNYPYLWESVNKGTTHIYESMWMKELHIYMRVCE